MVSSWQILDKPAMTDGSDRGIGIISARSFSLIRSSTSFQPFKPCRDGIRGIGMAAKRMLRPDEDIGDYEVPERLMSREDVKRSNKQSCIAIST
jgi:hypothetical protein